LAVQNKAEEVDTLFKEIDQAYALASCRAPFYHRMNSQIIYHKIWPFYDVFSTL